MEFVGKIVKKEFKGFGVFEGVVESYDSSTGFFKILYEDGDCEEADFSEVVRLASLTVVDSEKEKVMAKRVGRKPKQRRRNCHDPGKGSENLVADISLDQGNLETLGEIEPQLSQHVVNEINVFVNGNLDDGLDLNRGLDLDEGTENVEIRGWIDLNLSVENSDYDGEEKGKKERGFDLNLGFHDENAYDGELQNGDGIACQSTNHVNSSRTTDKLEEGYPDRRKRRKVAKNSNPPAETVLRRSARRVKIEALNESNSSREMLADEANEISISGVIDELEEKPKSLDLERPEGTLVLPPKMELPPSSTNLNLDDIPVLDLFSVYSCLRSFSTLLYLSPFELEDLVAALKSKVSNLLIDFIHVSILQTLRKHLEFLANEGSESASTCLRDMNWDLLDVVTWPVFMAEYLLIHGSGLKPGFSLDTLNLFDGEYYKQPVEVKLGLLCCLCDNVIEVEAIRLELGKRMIMAGAALEIDRAMTNGLYRKSRFSTEATGDSSLGEDVMDEVADGNSDECYLCKMDGNLICCDGCPAAYHSKCVGIVSSLLPDGDWYCPECVIGRCNFGKSLKLIRGAELLGNDHYGRLYFGCFDYLLVSDSYDAEASFNYYRKDDLSAVIQYLQSSDIFYGPILDSIYQHWAIPTDLLEPKSDLESGNCTSKGGKFDGRTEIPHASPEGSAEVLQGNQLIPNSPGPKGTSAAKKHKKNRSLAGRHRSLLKTKEEDVLQAQAGDGYVNHYSFAWTASSIVEELLRKPSDKVNIDIPKTEEELISIQLKFILKKSSKFCWTSIQDLNVEKQNEKCGWCYCCRFPVEGRDCLFNFTNRGPVSEGLKAEVDANLSKKNKKGHLVDVICYILCMEERLRGLLLGPWLSPHYSELWRNSVLKASNVSSLKRPLLTLESNLHPLALSADWSKHVDSVKTVGSAIHFVAKSRVTSKNGVSRKKGRYVDSETKSLIARGGLGLLWWRGGNVSRSLFNWKVVPRSLALKAARKAGCIKIPGIQYPDSLDNARRSKCVAWRASVETSTSLEQLALQVRELDLCVRWDDIENTNPQPVLDKESIKSIRLFKKVIIRRKCIEGTRVKYLLDFGKRRFIPDVVIKHGLKIEESSDERKKYWLEESYVPLHLLKSFEERRITRKAGKTNSSKVRKGGRVIKKLLRRKGFDYLFSRAERADSYQCGHCNKNVPISDAVSCRHCNGFFHKRHVMKCSDAITAGCTYTCHRCKAGKHVKTNSVKGKCKLGKLRGAKKLKVDGRGSSTILRAKPSKTVKALARSKQVLLGNNKKVQYHEQHLPQRNVYAGMTLRRSARKASNVPLQSDSSAGVGKRKRYNSRNVASKETTKGSYWKKRRSHILHSFWLKGLQLSRKPNDERVVQFKKRKLLVPSEFSAGIDDPLKCSLCSGQGFMSASTYIGCETCGDWFHGDAFGLNQGNIESVIGFKCHVCLDKGPPVCPFVGISGDTGALFTESTTEPGTQDSEGLPEVLVVNKETDCVDELHSDDISPGLIEVQTVQNSDGNLDHVKNPILDSELGVENGSSTSKEAEARAIEIQNGDLKSHDPNISNESQLTPLDETESQSPASKEVEAIAIESQNGDLKVDVPTAFGENSILEENKNIPNES